MRYRVFVSAMAVSALLGAGAWASEKTVMVGGAAMFPSKDIIDNAMNSSDHTTLVAAVKAAGLVETLKGRGPFTVFAPTNAAFAKLCGKAAADLTGAPWAALWLTDAPPGDESSLTRLPQGKTRETIELARDGYWFRLLSLPILLIHPVDVGLEFFFPSTRESVLVWIAVQYTILVLPYIVVGLLSHKYRLITYLPIVIALSAVDFFVSLKALVSVMRRLYRPGAGEFSSSVWVSPERRPM